MTKYILHGGFTPKTLQIDDLFFQEIFRDTPNDVKVLLVYFAKEDEKIEKNMNEDIIQFNKNRGEKKVTFLLATEKDFENQVKNSDIVYFPGGKSALIIPKLKKFQKLQELFKNKVIAADSAGVNALSSICFSNRSGEILEGTGILPFKTVCHYSDEYAYLLKEFAESHPNLELLALKEYEIRIIKN